MTVSESMGQDEPGLVELPQEVATVAGQGLEAIPLAGHDAGHVQDNPGQLSGLRIGRPAQDLEALHVLLGYAGLPEEVENLLGLLDGLAVLFRQRAQSRQTWIRWPLPENRSLARRRPQMRQKCPECFVTDTTRMIPAHQDRRELGHAALSPSHPSPVRPRPSALGSRPSPHAPRSTPHAQPPAPTGPPSA